MKKTITMLVILSLVTFAAYGQEWGFVGGLGNEADTVATSGHGIAVDPDGNIWYSPYYNSETVMIDTGSGTVDYEDGIRAVYVFTPDGLQTSFSPITTITVDGVTDTLQNSQKGLRANPDGNIAHGSYDTMYLINYLTGEGMKKVTPIADQSLTAPAFTSEGEMVVSYVFPGMGIDVYDSDWGYLGKYITAEMDNAYSRTVEVAKDGSAIFYTAYSGNRGFVRFNSSSGDIYGDFTASADTFALGLQNESVAWQPGTGYLWCGSKGTPGWTANAHYAFDPNDNFAVVDSILLPTLAVGDYPRGIAFSNDGNTAYLTCFSGAAGILKVVKGATGVWEHEGTFIAGYALKANYPNPFNPSTTLDVVLKEAGVADLRVYDMRGAEVAVLNSGYLSAGEHSFTFTAQNLATGVYIARFNVNGAMYTQTMTLVK